jgi:GDP-4-dehydro-6-deoxy-D-mannose reductase
LLARDPENVVVGTLHRSRVQDHDPPITYVQGDLQDAAFAERIVKEVAPDWVAHLAAQASVPESLRDPEGTLRTNLFGALHLMEAMCRFTPDARVLVVGSSEMYGKIRPEDLPANESTALRPENPYAASKVAQEFLGLQYHLGRGLKVIAARAFHLFGPGQSDQFATASFARQIAEAELGRRPPVLAVGNLSARRDYTDARDAARAYASLLLSGKPGETYNVGGGGVHAIGDILAALRAQARVAVEIRVDPLRFRAGEAPVVSCDASRIRYTTGWSPAIPFEQTVQDLLNYWRREVGTPD